MITTPTARSQGNPQALAASLVEDLSGLVSPPDVCLKVLEMIESQHASAQDIGEVVIRDPNLTARVLKLANSSFYNLAAKVDTVSRAITILGINELYGIVVAVSAVKSFSQLPNTVVNMDTFWRHSIYCGLVARNCASRLNYLHPERLFIAGLLHDVGSLVLYNRLPELTRDLLQIAAGDEEACYQLELEELGFSHATLGSLMLERWHLPVTLRDAVAFHHEPQHAEEVQMEAAIVHLANVVANRSEIGAFCEIAHAEQLPNPDVIVALEADSGSLDLEKLAGEAGLQFADAVAILAPSAVTATVT
jgi:HD-like signal output (HDOD) protein